MNIKRNLAITAIALTGMLSLPSASAQITNTVFSEDFSGTTLDTSKLVFQDHSLEGGKGDINYALHDGVVEFTGEVTQQWWAGATLRVVPTFSANAETNVMVTVDRVSELGTFIAGSATRSCLWIMDASRTFFVLFADDQNETFWEYNRYIGQSNDSQTGSGTSISAFSDAMYRDEGLHQMKAIANGKTVKLYLDDVFGAEVAFPFSDLVVEIGTGARAKTDVADTTFDNLVVQTIGAAGFSDTSLTMLSGQTVSDLKIRIPSGLNKTSPVTVRVVTSDPTIAVPVGASGDTLAVTFAAGASNEKSISVKSVGSIGEAQLTLANDIGLASANSVTILVQEGAGVQFSDDFSGSAIDTTKWTTSDLGFEVGYGTFTAEQTGGQLVLSGSLDLSAYWGGYSLNSVKTFTASPELPLVFEMDRVSIDPTMADGSGPSTAARTGVFVKNGDRGNYFFFGQNAWETGWEYNLNATGGGNSVAAFSAITNTGLHHIKLVADGSSIKMYLDEIYGGSVAYAVRSGIQFEVGVYARALGDAVKGVFDNVTVQHNYSTVQVSPTSINALANVNTNTVTVTVPRLLVANKAMNVTVTSLNPSVAIPAGAVNGALTLTFAAGSTNVQTFQVNALAKGTTSLTFTNDQSLATDSHVEVTVLPTPKAIFTDDFSASTLDTSKWKLDSTPLVATGTLTNSSVYITNGVLKMDITCLTSDWSGMAIFTMASYAASENSPVDFEVDRTKLEYDLGGGTGTLERTGVWVKDGTTNYVFFNFLDNHDASTVGGWQYNAVVGAAGDIALPSSGTVMSPLTGTSFLDRGNHHLKVQVNGKEAKLYVDGVFGAAAPFPFATGIIFGVGSYVNYANDNGGTVRGYFDNVAISTYASDSTLGSLSVTKQTNGDLLISWTGAGTLQSSSALPGNWSAVTPAPTGKSYTVSASALKGQWFFRLSQ
jgi:hypothetical protein